MLRFKEITHKVTSMYKDDILVGYTIIDIYYPINEERPGDKQCSIEHMRQIIDWFDKKSVLTQKRMEADPWHYDFHEDCTNFPKCERIGCGGKRITGRDDELGVS